MVKLAKYYPYAIALVLAVIFYHYQHADGWRHYVDAEKKKNKIVGLCWCDVVWIYRSHRHIYNKRHP